MNSLIYIKLKGVIKMNLLCKNIEKCFHQKYDLHLHTMVCEYEYAEDCPHCIEEIVPMWKDELMKVEQCPQRQDSLTDQMIDLHFIANKFGLYDAADYIRRVFIEK